MILRKLRIRRPRDRGICSRYRQVRDMESQLYKHEIARYILTNYALHCYLSSFQSTSGTIRIHNSYQKEIYIDETKSLSSLKF